MPICLVGLKPGCRTLRKTANCTCKRRELPVCLLSDGNGCERRREGKDCECDKMMLPQCVALGCEDRRKGHLCECPRWPGEPCQHVNAFVIRMQRRAGFDTLRRLFPAMAGRVDEHTLWARILWTTRQKVYGDRPAPSKGAVMIDRQARVGMMALRRKWGLSPWHPDDVRSPLGDADARRVGQKAQNFARLIGLVQGREGATNG